MHEILKPFNQIWRKLLVVQTEMLCNENHDEKLRKVQKDIIEDIGTHKLTHGEFFYVL